MNRLSLVLCLCLSTQVAAQAPKDDKEKLPPGAFRKLPFSVLQERLHFVDDDKLLANSSRGALTLWEVKTGTELPLPGLLAEGGYLMARHPACEALAISSGPVQVLKWPKGDLIASRRSGLFPTPASYPMTRPL
jgi:hypothetical protein